MSEKVSQCGGQASKADQSVGDQIQVEMLDGGVEKVNKPWDQGGNVKVQVWMEWKMDGQVVLGRDEVDG